MDTSRLKAVLDELIAESTNMGLAPAMLAFETAYQQYTTQPNATNGAAVTLAYESLKTGLTGHPSNNFSPSKFKILESIDGINKVGIGLLRRFDETMSGQQVPANVFIKIQQIKKDSTDFLAGLAQLSARLAAVGIEAAVLAEGQGEIGVTFPELTITDDLQSLAKEIEDLDFAIGTLSELYEDGTGSIEIRGIDQGSPLVFHLVASPELVHVVTFVISCLLKTITSIQAYRTSQAMIGKLLNQGAAAEAEKKLKEAETSVREAEKMHIETEIKALRDKIVQDSPMADGPRKNELSAQTYHALVYIAQRIDKGVDWEASAVDLDVPVKEGENPATSEVTKKYALDQTKKLSERNAVMFREIERTGEGILNLDAHIEEVEFKKAVEKNKEKKKGKKKGRASRP